MRKLRKEAKKQIGLFWSDSEYLENLGLLKDPDLTADIKEHFCRPLGTDLEKAKEVLTERRRV